MRSRRTVTLLGVMAVVAGALSATSSALPVAAKDSVIAQAARGQLRPARIPVTVNSANRAQAATQTYRNMPFFSGGVVDAAKTALEPDVRDTAGDTGAPSGVAGAAGSGSVNLPNVTGGSDSTDRNQLGLAARTLGCSRRLGQRDDQEGSAHSSGTARGNVRVNQDCTYRRQAEEIIKFNPSDPSNLIAGSNDSRVGFNQTNFAYSFDGGKTWGDGLPPFRQKLNNPAGEEPTTADPNRHTILGGDGTFHTYDACSDPAFAFDAIGHAYQSCVGFDIASDASLLYVTASPKAAGGAFYNNLSSFSRPYIVAEDNKPGVFHDKQFVTTDIFPNGPNRTSGKQNNVYVTWTVFRFSPACGPQPNPAGNERYCQSPIFGSMSTDFGVHWSTPELVSGTSDALCFLGDFFQPGSLPPTSCNFDQGSDPIVLPNGDLQVIFNNGNTAPSNPNSQQLGVLCKPSGNSATGTAKLNCVSPTKVGDDVSLGEPQCNFGRGPEECIPGAYIRTNDFPRIAVNRGNGNLYATWQDYRNQEFDIQLSVSTNGGLTWTEVGTVNPDRGLDHYFPAIDVVCSNSRNGEDGATSTKGGSDCSRERSQAQQGITTGQGRSDGESRQSLQCSAEDQSNRGEQSKRSPSASATNDHVGDSYYRTCRVPNENTSPPAGFAPGQPGVKNENSDYVLAGGRVQANRTAERTGFFSEEGAGVPFSFVVVSPTFPPPDGIQTGFNGDYSGLIVIGNEQSRGEGIAVAHPIWSDTRNAVPPSMNEPTVQGVIHDEDVFTLGIRLPDGHGEQTGG